MTEDRETAPERVTLTDEECVCLLESIKFYDAAPDDLWVEVENIITTRLTAREQAVRELIAGEIEGVVVGAGGAEWAAVRRVALRDAARIARGSAR